MLYRIHRRHRAVAGGCDKRESVAIAKATGTTLVEQPKGKELEYRVVAVNKAGEGKPSNTEMVVL